MSQKKLKGIVVLYVNLYPDLGQEIEPTLLAVREMNAPLLTSLMEDGSYTPIIVPTFKEATRLEKIDYDEPFPRYKPKCGDIEKIGVKNKASNAAIFQSKSGMLQGVISVFLNFYLDQQINMFQVLELVQKLNEESIKLIQEDGRYQLLFVPTTKEGTRIEKVDFEFAYPRLGQKKQIVSSKRKLNSNQVDDDFDETENTEDEEEEEDEE